MNSSYNLLNLSNNFINSNNYFKIHSNIVEHMDENDDDYEDEEGEFFEPPKCNNTSDCADHANLFDVSSDQLVCGNGWRYGDENNNYCLVKCTNDEFCNEKGIELGWNEGTTCKRNYCVIAQAEDPCTELKAEEYAPANGTFRINGDFIENPIKYIKGPQCSWFDGKRGLTSFTHINHGLYRGVMNKNRPNCYC